MRYQANEVIDKLKGLRGIKVLVIGDTIIDQYHYCSSIGKSPKDNVLVVRYLSEECFTGGVLAAANHIAGFCDNVHLATCLGRQRSYRNFIMRHLKKNIIPRFFYREDAPTIVKRRYVEPTFLTKMFGISFMDDHPLPDSVTDEICDWLDVSGYDVVVVTDYGHGFINNAVISRLIDAKFLAVNAQTNTDNMGFNLIGRYPRADYISLDEPETRLSSQNKYGDLNESIIVLSELLGCNKITVTHGSHSTLVYDGKNIKEIPILSREVKDTVGAGDAFFAISSLCAASDFPMDLVGFIGNAIGALKVKIVCNRSPVEPEVLFKFIKEVIK